jgi:hypothetical protein
MFLLSVHLGVISQLYADTYIFWGEGGVKLMKPNDVQKCFWGLLELWMMQMVTAETGKCLVTLIKQNNEPLKLLTVRRG